MSEDSAPYGAQRRTGQGKPVQKRDRAAEVANTFEWLITAFVLAFLFRAFVMEAFRIPTGSMADTLMGAHFRLRCPECGYEYEQGYIPRPPELPDTIPLGRTPVPRMRCPSCSFDPYPSMSQLRMPVDNGDRILVLKCVYQFIEPKRWDVIVFKNPLNPVENYIKRLIGLPGEVVEIIDGDVYINGLIARKPAAVQKELWMPVYNHDYQPIDPRREAFGNPRRESPSVRHRWQVPFDFGQSRWQMDANCPVQLTLDSPPDQEQVLTYGGPAGNDFRAYYAYNYAFSYDMMPPCSDLMLRFYARAESTAGKLGISLSKYGIEYRAWVDLAGEMVIAKIDNGQATVLNRRPVKAASAGKYVPVQFANVDHQLIFRFGDTDLTYDLGRSPDAAGPRNNVTAQAKILGAGKLTLRHVAVFRDIHYTKDSLGSAPAPRAIEGKPFPLEKDEFFALGDNSPNSEDGRWWSEPTVCNRGSVPPRAGVVPRDYLVGKALLVYWPGGYEFPWPQGLKQSLLERGSTNRLMRVAYSIASLRWIPNFGRMRFIYGGTDTPPADQPRRP